MPGRGMPEAATVEGIGAHAGRTVTLHGWLAGRRSSGKLHFLQVRDGTGTIQCVMAKAEVPAEVFALADHLPQESSLVVTGTVRADARSPIGYELGVSDLQVVHQSADYPITPKEHGPAFLLDHRHLWLRSSRQHALLRVRSEVIRACREYLDGHGFLAFDAPILTPAACEGTTTLFPVQYFDETAYLTQSGQLYAEAGAMAFPRIAYAEALDILGRKGFPLEWGADLGGDEETALSEEFDRPVMVHRYPAEAKAFYMKADPADPRLALCVDVLAPEGYGEIIGGGQREDDAAVLEAKIRRHELPLDAFGWYLDLRRYGSVPHAGFGMGIERCVAWLCGLHHVRETIPFPRLLERLRP